MKRPREACSVANGTTDAPNADTNGSKASSSAQKPGKTKERFVYGNYHRYYGYRVGDHVSNDLRVRWLQREWFVGKDCLDVGCNEGLLSIFIAQQFEVRRMLGVDIDRDLINEAYCRLRQVSRAELASTVPEGGSVAVSTEECGAPSQMSGEEGAAETREVGEGGTEEHMPRLEHSTREDGPCRTREPGVRSASADSSWIESDLGTPPPGMHSQQQSSLVGDTSGQAVSTRHVESEGTECQSGARAESLLTRVRFLACNILSATMRDQSYDVVTCLSVTKWVHLNWGDRGVIDLFSLIFNCLRTGGIFILEPQPWKSYTRNKGVSQVARKNYSEIKLRPEEFRDILLDKIGFSSCQLITPSIDPSKGFGRPLFLFRK